MDIAEPLQVRLLPGFLRGRVFLSEDGDSLSVGRRKRARERVHGLKGGFRSSGSQELCA